MPLTMDDDGAILVHLTNPGGIVGGSGVANQITYWTDTDTIGGDLGLTYDVATNSLTIAGNILMADDKFVGITGDIRIEFDQTDGDIMFHLGDVAGGDEVQVVDSGGGVVAYVDSDGNADFEGHAALGAAATVSSTTIFLASDTLSAVAGGLVGIQGTVTFAPAADFSTTVYGFVGQVILSTAHARTGGTIIGHYGAVLVQNNVAATALDLAGGYYMIDVEDAAASIAKSLAVYTPYVDAGSCANAYGLLIAQGSLGVGSIAALTGIYIASMTAGTANYAIYSAGGKSYHVGKVSIGGPSTALAQLHVDQSSGSGAVPVLLLDQADLSEEFIELTTTVGAGNPVDTASIGTYYGKMRVNITGVGYKYIALYNS